ncbi:MAG: SDR family oxidoreductase [Candidatus Acidiferrales bacterium]
MTPDAAGSPEGILIWGAGAIGGTVAAYLRRAGVDVTAVDANGAHVQAIRERGLAITGPIEGFVQPLPACRPDDVTGTWNTIFLCVKAQHTEAAAKRLAPHLAPDGVVVSLQNGFNELAIAEVVGRERTMGAFINFGADVLEPSVVHFGGRGAVVIGELDGRHSERLARVHRALRHFEPDAIITDNIWGYLWGKMGYGSLLFASALTPASIVEVLDSRDARPALTALAREVMSVAATEGIAPMGFNGYDPTAFGANGTSAEIDSSFDAMVAFNRRSAKTHSGVWRDIAVHHRKTECAAQFAPILKLAQQSRVAIPFVERLVSLMREVEDGVRPQTLDNLARLNDEFVLRSNSRHSGAIIVSMQISFDGRTAIVTGAAHGFGRSIGLNFASLGAHVVACDVLEDELAETARLAKEQGTPLEVRVLDVGDRAAVQGMVSETLKTAGRIDVLVNDAGGVMGQVGRPLEEVSETDWRAIFAVNLDGAFYFSQAVAPAMKAARYGRIINISSGAGLGVSLTGIQAYASAKAGQIGLTRQLAHELGPWGITVNNVAPGFVRSNPTTEKQWQGYGEDGQRRLIENIALKRLGSPQDIANGVLFFASEHAGWITGQTLSIDGGK